MSKYYFVFERKDNDGKPVPYATVYLPDVQAAYYINDGRTLYIRLQRDGDVTVAVGDNTNAVDFFATLARLSGA